MERTIEVDETDIQGAKLHRQHLMPGRWSCNCPIARALRRQGFPLAAVGMHTFDRVDGSHEWVDLPEEARAFIRAFDFNAFNNPVVRPFTFTIHV